MNQIRGVTGAMLLCLSLALAGCGSDNADSGPIDPGPITPKLCMAAADSNPWMQRQALNIAHRGGAFEFPENTLYAYHQALAAGADMLEMDIYQSADGELIVIHDESVDRTTEGSGRIAELTTAEIQALDAAHWFIDGRGARTDGSEGDYRFRGVASGERSPPPGFAAEDFRIPTLREVLERFPNTLINIELKPDPEGAGDYEARLAGLLAEFERGEEVIVASFLDLPSIRFKNSTSCIATAVPTVQVAAFILTSIGPLPGLVLNHQAFQVPMELGIPVVTPNFIRSAHQNNVAVHVWTINDCAEMAALLEMGVDGIMTDRPGLLHRLLVEGQCPD
jgi:glycerophosphoryl diester phosphodiesterase